MSYAEASLETPSNSIVPVTVLPRAHGIILVVEDEAFVREATCEILESAGYRVLKAQNATEARITFQRYKKIVHLLVVDVVLPGQNGRDLVHELRKISPSLRAIFISGYPENAVTRHGLQEDGTFYLPKPFSGDSLMQKVNQVLQG